MKTWARKAFSRSSMDLNSKRGTFIDFSNDKTKEDEEGWLTFEVRHEGGVHDLFMAYTSETSNPLQIKIGDQIMWVSVAFGTPISSENFLEEGTFDLREAGTVKVSFRPIGEWPKIRAFTFIPENHDDEQHTCRHQKSYFGFEPSKIDEKLSSPSMRWKRSPTAVTYSFEFGNFDIGSDYEYQAICLQGKSIKFTYGEAHDCMALNGDPIGDQYGGENFPEVTRIEQNSVIKSVVLGISTYNGEAAFHSIAFHDQKTRLSEQRLLVGAMLKEPSYIFDREKLGLNLWLTSICAPAGRPVARYGFTLSSDPDIDFNPQEFEVFWKWLVDMKSQIVQKKMTCDSVRDKMAPLHDFLLSSFSEARFPSDANDGWLYSTKHQISLTYDVFSLLLHKMPGSDEWKKTFFVDGKQYDISEFTRLEEVPLRRNDILAYAISSAASDTDLLYQMGLIRPSKSESTDDFVNERELLDLRKSGHLFSGDYASTPLARRAMVILATCGLRKAGSTILTDDRLGWDIYSLAAQKRSESHSIPKSLMLVGASMVCSLIQIVIPVFLFYRAVIEEKEALQWDTYIARLLFLTYAAFAEVTSWELDREDRVVAWLCFFPEWGTKRLVFGRIVNQLSKLVTTIATIGLIVNSFTVFDVTLNSLALYYILDLDDNLVDENAMERIRNFHEEEYLILKSKLALEYRQVWFDDSKLPKIQELPARYFLLASQQIGYLCGAMLIGAVGFTLVAPWFVTQGGFD